jgi:hypothetical protein
MNSFKEGQVPVPMTPQIIWGAWGQILDPLSKPQWIENKVFFICRGFFFMHKD